MTYEYDDESGRWQHTNGPQLTNLIKPSPVLICIYSVELDGAGKREGGGGYIAPNA